MLEKIKKIREMTGAGVVDVKKALDEAGQDEAKAIDILRKKGQSKALKKADRLASEGFVGSYIHSNGKIGALVKLLCETDFVARNSEFQELAKDIAMHVAAMNPQFVKPEEVSDDVVNKEKAIWTEQLKNEGKPENIWEKIMAGKEKKLRDEVSLFGQPFVKDPEKTVHDLVTEKIAKMGENIQVGGFVRFDI